MGVYYAITFFILKALNVDVGPDKLVFIICSTAFAITMCVFIPTPGGSGGIEFAFKSIFQAVAVGITAEVAMGGMLLWRLLSYYLMMLLSFFIYLALEKITLKREKDIMNILPRIKKKTGIGKEENLVTDVVVNEDNFGENIESVETENSELDTNIDSDRVDNQEMENLETCEQFTSEIVEEEENKKDVELASEDNVEIK